MNKDAKTLNPKLVWNNDTSTIHTGFKKNVFSHQFENLLLQQTAVLMILCFSLMCLKQIPTYSC